MEVTLMTNKEKLKNAIEQDINPKDYYTEIINQGEKGEKMKKNNILKWSLMPIYLFCYPGHYFLCCCQF